MHCSTKITVEAWIWTLSPSGRMMIIYWHGLELQSSNELLKLAELGHKTVSFNVSVWGDKQQKHTLCKWCKIQFRPLFHHRANRWLQLYQHRLVDGYGFFSYLFKHLLKTLTLNSNDATANWPFSQGGKTLPFRAMLANHCHLLAHVYRRGHFLFH